LKKINIKYILIGFAAIVLVGAIVMAVAQPAAVECLVLKESALETTFNEMGEVVPLSEVDLFSKTGGKLLSVKAIEGSPVRKGDVLFVFDDSDLRNEEASILAEILVIESQIKSQLSALGMQKSSFEADKAGIQTKIEQTQLEEEKQRKDFESAKLLYENGAVSAQDLDNAKIAYETAAKNSEALAAQLKYLTAARSRYPRYR